MLDSQNSPPSPQVEVSFSLRIGDGNLRASLEVPAGQTTLTQLLPILQNFDSGIVNHIAQEASAVGRPISCRAGCGACCRQMVPLSVFEAEALYEWFLTLPEARQAELEKRFHEGLLALRNAGVLEELLERDWLFDMKSVARISIDYFHVGVPCPFLENESCSIHAIRPLSCREYIVTSPPELCRDPSVNDVVGVLLPLRPSAALYRLGQQLEQEGRGWFPLIFLLAWGKKGMKPGDYVSGTGQEVLRTFIDQLATLPPADEGASPSPFMQPS
jgi:Fe-S-cluster containining protein